MQLGSFELAVAIHRDGRSPRIVREYGLNGLTYVEGRQGQPFSLILRNNSPSRVLAILSVDGQDVIDGQPATSQSRGYVIGGYSSTEIKGWRTSLNEVRQFFFQGKDGSYAASTAGSVANCGVIAARIIDEKPKPKPAVVVKHVHHHHHHPKPYHPYPYPYPWTQPIWSSSTADTAQYSGSVIRGSEPLALAPDKVFHVEHPETKQVVTSTAADFNLGTGWGEAAVSQVSEVSFERGAELLTLTLYYSDAAGLTKAGISLEKEPAIETALPQAFAPFCRPPAVRG